MIELRWKKDEDPRNPRKAPHSIVIGTSQYGEPVFATLQYRVMITEVDCVGAVNAEIFGDWAAWTGWQTVPVESPQSADNENP